ncbi:MAG: hypothetical protein RID15_16790 [Marinovum algicola]|jgi:hypothetical protein|uniref:Uncharacterized protein n=1 Tax=Marinovum algicola TaxID=42444 RepID=A0A975WDL1_9RHOB|nr:MULTISPECIES: hypothetical protein [Marinovum]AKO97329.1 hypothetical protein MALG_02162 [Marinovum algicola DG 898]MDD9740341.1 hypothetical protein [Marinovum sp. SP66]MDD9745709.1 hypothetical protein [Marinovum sp. PR37]SEK02297.1 hypothetical protein SAMN04487940_11912 [Marinovum algicola]SLN74361.1 hypothetical protein MAA5396_04283 [Marinovum algicola]
MTRLLTLLAAGFLASATPPPAQAFGAGTLPLLTFPSDPRPQGDTPTRGPCLLCPKTAG